MDSVGEPDRVLVHRSAAGDRRAFAALFDRHSRAVTRYAWALVSDRLDVQEIVQDTFTTAWSKAGSVTIAESSALPWLLVTCRNHALNLRRKKAPHRAEPLPEALAGLADVAANEDRALAVQRLRWVQTDIEALDGLDRRICELCLVEGRSYAEAAAIVGASVGAMGTRRASARNRNRVRRAVSNHDE